MTPAGLSLLLVLHSFLTPSLARWITQPHVDLARAGFGFLRPASPDASIDFTLVLPPADIGGLHDALFQVSDPASTRYGKHLSKPEVHRFVSPDAYSSGIVLEWLTNANYTPRVVSPSGDMLRVSMPILHANTLFNASFAHFLHAPSNSTMTRTLSYSLPDHVAPHVAFVYPTTQFIPPPSRGLLASKSISRSKAPYHSKRADIPDKCAQYTTPDCLQAIYAISSAPATASRNSIAVSGFLDDIATLDDLREFSSTFRPDIEDPTFSALSIDNGATSGPATREASLDIDYTVGLATDVPVQFLSVGDSTYKGLLDLTNFLLAQDELPLVLTTSYGYDEPLFAQYPEMAHTLCNAYAQLGARGTTVIFSSGDGGVAGHKPSTSPACDSGRQFIPTFPSTCPYVTSVGGTTGKSPETAAPFSAGGFSNIFPRPSYQDSAVSSYLSLYSSSSSNATSDSPSGRFNASGRAFPDLSILSTSFVVVASSPPTSSSSPSSSSTSSPDFSNYYAINGTSASAPTLASIVALLNDARLRAGQPPLGFLNPLVYSSGAGTGLFTDVTQGSNPGCGSQGFSAAPGWDPVTGLGTPAYDRLLALVTGGVPVSAKLKNGGARSGSGQRPLVPAAMQLAVFVLWTVVLRLCA